MESSSFEVRPIMGGDEMEEVYKLTYRIYLRQEYCEERPDGKLSHYPHLDNIPETTVLVAVDRGGRIIGTNSFTMDGPHGLHVDKDYKEQTECIRGEGKRLAASWRIVTQESCRDDFQVVMRLIRATAQLFLEKNTETCLFTFNPCHEGVYQRLIGAQTIAYSPRTKGLSNAESVLMRVDEFPQRFRRSR